MGEGGPLAGEGAGGVEKGVRGEEEGWGNDMAGVRWTGPTPGKQPMESQGHDGGR